MQYLAKWNLLVRASIAQLGLVFMLFVYFPGVGQADWKEELGSFRIGVVVGGNTSAGLAQLEPFRLAVAEKLGITVEIIPNRDLSTLVRNHAEGRIEYAVLSAAAYGAAWGLCECVEPLVIAASSDGTMQSHSVLITRKASGIATPQSAIGKKIIALNENSVLGYGFALFELQQQKVDLLGGGTQFVFFETAEKAVTAFAKGEGDVLIGWKSNTADATSEFSRGTLSQLNAIDPALSESLRVIWTSSGVPHRMHSIRKNLPGEPKKLLRDLLGGLFSNDPVAYDSIEPDYSGGFIIAQQNMFDKISEFAKQPIIRQSNQDVKSKDDTVEDAASKGEQ